MQVGVVGNGCILFACRMKWLIGWNVRMVIVRSVHIYRMKRLIGRNVRMVIVRFVHIYRMKGLIGWNV